MVSSSESSPSSAVLRSNSSPSISSEVTFPAVVSMVFTAALLLLLLDEGSCLPPELGEGAFPFFSSNDEEEPDPSFFVITFLLKCVHVHLRSN